MLSVNLAKVIITPFYRTPLGSCFWLLCWYSIDNDFSSIHLGLFISLWQNILLYLKFPTILAVLKFLPVIGSLALYLLDKIHAKKPPVWKPPTNLIIICAHCSSMNQRKTYKWYLNFKRHKTYTKSSKDIEFVSKRIKPSTLPKIAYRYA